ncbi:ATP-binding protein [Enterovibrio norvegicus]|uniref:ATP-binding protein n=1 Tax=Enterovibrio norvegicus TaxID=188144 RepID=UPI00352E5F3D
MNKSIELHVDENSLINNLQYLFASSARVINELMQNARRANATCVTITVNTEKNMMSFVDDGQGISDFQNLLSIGQSGWNEDVALEQPYGMGFTSCLFCCEEIEVHSKGQSFRANTKQILDRECIELTPSQCDDYTDICLHNYDITFPKNGSCFRVDIRSYVTQISKGLPIDVKLIVDGENVVINAPDSLRALEKNTDYNKVALSCGTLFVRKNTFPQLKNVCSYLQGLPIKLDSERRDISKVTAIVHFDSDIKARLPDRDVLIEEEQYQTIVKDTLELRNRDVLTALKRNALDKGDDGLVELFSNYNVLMAFEKQAIDLMNDLPLPGAWIGSFNDGLVGSVFLSQAENYQWDGHLLTKEMTAEHLLLGFDPIDEYCCCTEITELQYVSSTRALWVTKVLDKNHWFNQVEKQSRFEVTPSVNSPHHDGTLLVCGDVGAASVVLCESVTLDGPFGTEEFTHSGVAIREGVVAVPDEEKSGDFVQQAYDYCDEHGHACEDDYDSDVKEIAYNLSLLRSKGNKTKLLELLLSSLDVSDFGADDKFLLSFDKEGIKVQKA